MRKSYGQALAAAVAVGAAVAMAVLVLAMRRASGGEPPIAGHWRELQPPDFV